VCGIGVRVMCACVWCFVGNCVECVCAWCMNMFVV